MRQLKLLGLSSVLMLAAGSAQAAKLYVNVLYGSAGSHGSYVCELYRDGYHYQTIPVRNTGTAGGQAVFDVPRRSHYFALVRCVTNGTAAQSPGRWFQLYFAHMNLDVRFYN